MLPQVCPGTPACAFRMSNVLRMWHMRGVFEDMLLCGGVLLARAAGEAAGGKFFAKGEADALSPQKIVAIVHFLDKHAISCEEPSATMA